MRPEMRPAIFAGRLPEVHFGPAKMFISGPSLVQMYFDGIHPRTIIAKIQLTTFNARLSALQLLLTESHHRSNAASPAGCS
jgi:hypothetical protein